VDGTFSENNRTAGSGFENSPMHPAVVIITTFWLFRRYFRCPFGRASNERYSNPPVIPLDDLRGLPVRKEWRDRRHSSVRASGSSVLAITGPTQSANAHSPF